MFGIGLPELLVILVVALVVLGPKRLPEVARQLGRAVNEFRRHSSDILEEFQQQVRLDEESTPTRRRPAPSPAAASPAAQPVAGTVASRPAPEPSSGADAAPAPAAAPHAGDPTARG